MAGKKSNIDRYRQRTATAVASTFSLAPSDYSARGGVRVNTALEKTKKQYFKQSR
jgi:hypothetical protein